MAPSAEPPSLELREAAGAFERIEEWLRELGFFAPVWDSDPAAEDAQSWTKAQPLLDAIGAGTAAAGSVSGR
jgi:hypothetical protein